MSSIKKINEWEVLTPNGWSDFSGVSKLRKSCYVRIEFDDNTWVECSENHKVKLVAGEFVYAKNLKSGMVLLGKDSINKVVRRKRKINKTVDLYDLNNVNEDNEFYSNDIISHNCALIEDAEDLWTSALPTLSTGGNSIILSCVTKDTMVITSHGIKTMGDFIDTSKIGGYNIEKYGVLGVNKIRCGTLFHNNGLQKTNIIKTKFSELECTGNHKLWAYKNKDQKFGWYESSELETGDYVSIQYGSNLWGNNDSICNFHPSVSSKIHSPFNPLQLTPDLCYLLGLYISEGSVYKVLNKNGNLVGGNLTITCGDDISWVFDKLNFIYSSWDRLHYTISNKNLIEFMEYLGFDLSCKAHEKYIPTRLLEMSGENIKWLLKGIFDGDGSGTKKTVSLASTSKKLIRQVRMILLNFGILGGVYFENKETCNSRGHRIKHNHDPYSLQIYGRYALRYYNVIGFALARKQKNKEAFLSRNFTRSSSQDVIPNTSELIRKLVKSSGLPYSEIKKRHGIKVTPYMSPTTKYKTDNISRDNVMLLYSLFSEYLSEDDRMTWDKIIGESVVWCEIVSIISSENETFDFSLPDNSEDFWCHSVIYNGLIGHQTPRGYGNFFHKMWQGASDDNKDGTVGRNGFHPIILPWHLHPDRDEEWRRISGEKQGDPKKAAQEYDCNFLSSGNSVVDLNIIEFYKKNKAQDPIETQGLDRNLWIWEYPDRTHTYIVSADVARGDGEDYSACHVLDISKELVVQVAEYKGKIPTKDFGDFLVGLATRYNDALLIIERENVGWGTIQEVLDRGYKNTFYSSADLKYVDVHRQFHNSWAAEDKKLIPGFSTNISTRQLVISDMERYMRQMAVEIRSKRTLAELETFIWKNGKAVAMDGYNDDLCVLGDTWIRTNVGYKIIKDVNVGDYVLTHKNRFRKVMSKFISEKSGYNILSTTGKMDLGITGNHPLYIFDKILGNEAYYNLHKTWNKISEPYFKSIDELSSVQDKYLSSVILNDEVIDINTIDLWDYATNNSCLNGETEITSLIITDNTAKVNPKTNNISRYINVDEGFCFLMGYFLAEGSKSRNGISFASHQKESKLRRYISSILQQYGFNPIEYYSKNNLGCILYIQSLILRKFFEEFGKSTNKNLPIRFSKLPKTKLIYILCGYLAGDGCFYKNSVTSVTISPHIAFQMHEIASKCGIVSTIKGLTSSKAKIKVCSFDNIKRTCFIQPYSRLGFNLTSHPAFKLLCELREVAEWSEKVKHERIKLHNGFVLGELSNVVPVKLNAPIKLYNLEVDEDNSYTANGIVVHNCMALGIGLRVRDTALRLRQEGIELTRAAVSGMTKEKMDQTPFYKVKQAQTGHDSWTMKTGRQGFGKQNTEDLKWLL